MKVKKVLKSVVNFVVWYLWYFLIVFSSFFVGVCTALPGVYGSESSPVYFIFPVDSCLWFYALVFAIIVLFFFVFHGFLSFLLDKFIVYNKNCPDYKKENDDSSNLIE